MFSFVKNEKGYSLPTVVIISMISLILIVAIVQTSTAENIFAAKNEGKLKAYYIARSGAHSVAEYMLNDPGNAADIIGKTSQTNTQIGGGSFTVSVKEESADAIIITSVGEFNGVQQTVRVRVAATAPGIGGIFGHALVARDGINVANSAGSGIDITGSIITQNGVINLGSHGRASEVKPADKNLIFPPIIEPPNRNPAISYNHVHAIIDNSLTIQSNEHSPTYVYASGIDLGNNRTISVSGNGVVHMFVNGNITMGTGSRFDSAAGKLYVYVIGARNVTFSGRGSQNNVFFYAPDSAITWNNAQPHNNWFGSIIGRTITLHNHLKIAHNPAMVNGIDLDTGSVGVTYTGYTWRD